VARGGLAALDAVTGRLLDWDPRLQATQSLDRLDPAFIWRLFTDGTSVYAGGDIRCVGPEPAANIVRLAPAFDSDLTITRRIEQPAFTIAPSPARGMTSVRFALASPGSVSVSLYDVRGRRVLATLDRVFETAGPHQASLRLSGLSAGIYFCRLDLAGRSETRKIVVLAP
jgi:hypothetical protein